MITRIFAVSLALVAGASGLPAAAQAGDPGEAAFNMRCKACHTVAPGGASTALAPNLRGVVGRKAGASTFKNYSPALKAASITWNAASLDKFLTAPTKLVPGTRMVMAVGDANQRKSIVAWLAKQR
ncbi:c-type cytochrome [Novosphingobium sp.]|uniref:c-type cytochrome n=1 Tax=Novosphingobium sp. TaxID=1874826 RepID=UPI00286DFD2D|nr:c-type cytochrome [Novosphingobium sp.]